MIKSCVCSFSQWKQIFYICTYIFLYHTSLLFTALYDHAKLFALEFIYVEISVIARFYGIGLTVNIYSFFLIAQVALGRIVMYWVQGLNFSLLRWKNPAYFSVLISVNKYAADFYIL